MKKIRFDRHKLTPEFVAFFADLGYKWHEVLTAHGAISDAFFYIDVDGVPTELEHGDFIVHENGNFSIQRLNNQQ